MSVMHPPNAADWMMVWSEHVNGVIAMWVVLASPDTQPEGVSLCTRKALRLHSMSTRDNQASLAASGVPGGRILNTLPSAYVLSFFTAVSPETQYRNQAGLWVFWIKSLPSLNQSTSSCDTPKTFSWRWRGRKSIVNVHF